jgi:hypothetical protein
MEPGGERLRRFGVEMILDARSRSPARPINGSVTVPGPETPRW